MTEEERRCHKAADRAAKSTERKRGRQPRLTEEERRERKRQRNKAYKAANRERVRQYNKGYYEAKRGGPSPRSRAIAFDVVCTVLKRLRVHGEKSAHEMIMREWGLVVDEQTRMVRWA